MVVMVKRVGKPPVVQEIALDSALSHLSAVQGLVGGYVESVPFENDMVMLVNEDGRIMKLPPNLVSYRGVLVGTVVFCGVQRNEWVGLTAKQIEFAKQYCERMAI